MGDIVVITSSAGTLPGLGQALRAIPLTVEEHPLMSFTPPADWMPVDRALDRLTGYGSVAFTSPRAAEAVVNRIGLRRPSSLGSEPQPMIWAAGPATAAALRGVLGEVRTPSEFAVGQRGAAVALAHAMLDAGIVSPVLFLCGETHRDELPAVLRANGLNVDEVVCYRSVLAPGSVARAASARAAVLVVSSPSVAALLATACGSDRRPSLVAVGPTTAASAREHGWEPAAVASVPDVAAVTSAVQSVLATR